MIRARIRQRPVLPGACLISLTRVEEIIRTERVKELAHSVGVTLSDDEIRLNTEQGLLTLIDERMSDEAKAEIAAKRTGL